MLLIENDRGVQVLIVDPDAEMRMSAGGETSLAKINPGDHIDYAVSSWAGMQIVDLVHVTPRPGGGLARFR
jgi:hypothetical protein